MIVMLLASVACMGQLATLEGDPALVQFLRDAQVTNRAALRAGHLGGSMSEVIDGPKGVLRRSARFEIWWDGPKTFWKIKLVDPSNLIAPRPSDYDWAIEPEWDYILRADGKCTIYNGTLRRVAVNDVRTFDVSFIEASPWDSWFYFYPPLGSAGTLWSDSIGPTPGSPSKFVVKRQGDDLIRQTRTDPDGGVVLADFSISRGGNVVAMSCTASDPSQAPVKGTYAWMKRDDGVCALEAWHFEIGRTNRPETGDLTHDLRIDFVDIKTPVPAERFDFAALCRQLPANVVVQDNIKRTSTVTNVKSIPIDMDKVLGDLAPKLRRRGFLDRP